jgi:hypothetical protein
MTEDRRKTDDVEYAAAFQRGLPASYYRWRREQLLAKSPDRIKLEALIAKLSKPLAAS